MPGDGEEAEREAEQAEAKETNAEDSNLDVLLSETNEYEKKCADEQQKDNANRNDDGDMATYLRRVDEMSAAYPKLKQMISAAEDRAAAMRAYLAQMKAFEDLKENVVSADCIVGEVCDVKLPSGRAEGASYALESELPCTGQAHLSALLLSKRTTPSSWSSPREGRGCPEETSFGDIPAKVTQKKNSYAGRV